MNARILLLSAYDAASHRLWRNRLQRLFPDCEWTQLALPPRHFNWRIRGNSLQWASNESGTLSRSYELLICTSMVDLTSLRGFIPSLCHVPTLLYFHENQFAYPVGGHKPENIEHQLVPLYAALCADAIAFNSQFNRSTFLQGARSLLRRLPDEFPDSIMHKLQTSEVIPVPIDAMPVKKSVLPDSGGMLEVVWNHRWEYDKGIELLEALVNRIRDDQLPLRFHIAGEQFRQQPPQFARIDQALTEHASRCNTVRGQFGFISSLHDYLTLLSSCDVVLSTALHDFQGLAIQEAAACGCTPLAPADLAYPEYLEQDFLYRRGENLASATQQILERLLAWQQQKLAQEALPKANLDTYSMTAIGERYADLFRRLGQDKKESGNPPLQPADS